MTENELREEKPKEKPKDYDTKQRDFFTRLLGKGFLGNIPFPIAAFLVFYTPVLIFYFIISNPLFFPYPTIYRDFLSPNFLVQIIASLDIPLCIILIRWYEENVFWKLWNNMRPLIEGEGDKEKFEGKYEKFRDDNVKIFYYRKTMGIAAVIFTIIVSCVSIYGYFGFFGSEPYQLWYRIILVIFVSYIYSFLVIVFMFVVKTAFEMTKLINKFQKNEDFKYNLRPLHYDRFGGLSAIGNVAINTALFVSVTCTILVPWLLYGMVATGPINIGGIFWFVLTLVLMIGVMVLILTVFLIPSLSIHRIAKKEKRKLFDAATGEYNEAFTEYEGKRKIKKLVELNKEEIQHLAKLGTWTTIQRNRFLEVEKMKVFPFSTKILAELISALVVPILIGLLVEYMKYLQLLQ